MMMIKNGGGPLVVDSVIVVQRGVQSMGGNVLEYASQ